MNRILGFCLIFVPLLSDADEPRRPPNVILMMTDNHGAWTLGCYGNRDIQTPHIDRLAYEGIRFTRAYSSNAVCSPSRATWLTGLLPSQHGVHCFLRKDEAQMDPGAYDTIAEFRSLPKVLSENGYTCGLVGKWHLGGNLTPQQGFSEWVTMPHGATSEFYDAEVIENGEVRIEPKSLTDLWTDRAVKFITDNQEQPFFLFLSYNGPYGLGPLLLNPPRNRHYNTYAEELFPSFPRGEKHPWLFNNHEYFNNVVAIRRFAAELSGIDDSVGTVLETLLELGIDQDTLIVFCADQGWVGGQNGLWGMGDHTRPLTAFDGMLHIPLIFRHTTRIRPGQTSDVMVGNYDFMPTLLSYLGLSKSENLNAKSPGRDFSEVLNGKTIRWQNLVFYEMENVRSIRTSTAKYVHRHPDGPHELYDLETDPGEKVNLYGQSAQSELQKRLSEGLTAFFELHADPKYDLYRRGGSKTKLLSDPEKQPIVPAKP